MPEVVLYQLEEGRDEEVRNSTSRLPFYGHCFHCSSHRTLYLGKSMALGSRPLGLVSGVGREKGYGGG